jgi:hypothetical protein
MGFKGGTEMRICENGIYRDMTPEEITEMEAQTAERERQYWQTTTYDDAVDAEIRKRYTVSQEFAILRQRDEKPVEYAEYYVYCEQCKAYVKEKQSL